MCAHEGSSWGVSRVMNRLNWADLFWSPLKCCCLWCAIWISKKQLGTHSQHIPIPPIPTTYLENKSVNEGKGRGKKMFNTVNMTKQIKLKEATRVWRGEEKQSSRPHIQIDAPQAFIMLHLSLLTAMLKIQSLWRRDIWETAQANKGQDKGKMWAMVMQLNAEPTHEYGSCGADSGDALSWCVRSMHCMPLLVWPHNLTHKLCMSSHFYIFTDMLHVLRDQPPPTEGTDVSLSARGQLSLLD